MRRLRDFLEASGATPAFWEACTVTAAIVAGSRKRRSYGNGALAGGEWQPEFFLIIIAAISSTGVMINRVSIF
jgi:hypothetical protein